MLIRHAPDGLHDDLEQEHEPHSICDRNRRTNQPPALEHGDEEAERDRCQGDVFACEHRQRHRRPQQAVLLVERRVKRGRYRRHREDDVVEVEHHARQHTPEQKVGAQEREAGDVADSLDCP